MPARLPDSKEGGKKSVVKGKPGRRPCATISKPRPRNVGGARGRRQLPGMIVTMSVSQSDGIALQTPGRVATSRTRQVSTASALFDTSGMSIDVVCESTTENREVVMNMLNDPKTTSKYSSNCIDEKTETLNMLPLKFAVPDNSSFYFLREDQLEILLQYKVNNLKEILHLTLREFLTIGLNKEQYGILLLQIEKEGIVPQKENANQLHLGNFGSEGSQREVDEDDQPLVIDENIASPRENQPKRKPKKIKPTVSMRSLDEIEQCVSVIKNVKIPRSRAAITKVVSELTGIIADLNAKEEKLIHDQAQLEKPIKIDTNALTPGENQEPVISTSKLIDSNKVITRNRNNLKKENVNTFTKRVTKSRTKKTGVRSITCGKNVEIGSDLDLTANQPAHVGDIDEKATSSTQNSSTKSDLTSLTKIDCASFKVNDASNYITTDCKTQQSDSTMMKTKNDCIASPFTHIFVVAPGRVNSLGSPNNMPNVCTNLKRTQVQPNKIASNTKIVSALFPNGQKPMNSQHLSNSASATVPQLSKCGIIYINPIIVPSNNVGKQDEKKPVQTKGESIQIIDVDEKNMDNKVESLVKVHSYADSVLSTKTDCSSNKTVVGTESIDSQSENNSMPATPKERAQLSTQKICKTMKSFSAAPIQPNFQPTVMLKKLPPFLRMQDNVDADSTTNCLEVGGCTGKKSDYNDTIKKVSAKLNEQRRTVLTDERKLMPAKDHKKVKARQVTVLNVVDLTMNVVEDVNNVSTDETAHKISNYSDLNFPESPPFEVIKTCADKSEQLVTSINNHTEKKSNEEESYVDGKRNMMNAKCVALVSQDCKGCDGVESKVAYLHKESDSPCDDQDSAERSDETFKEHDSPKSQVESRKGRSVQRRIDFDSKFGDIRQFEYDCDDVDAVAAIASTPLSPISCGIASPTITKANLSDYTPAMEIDGHMSYPAILYLLYEIDLPYVAVNKPDGLDNLLRSSITDPRLLKFNIKGSTAVQASTTQPCIPTQITSADPRRANSILNTDSYVQHRQQPTVQQTPNMLLYGCLQRSPWYQSLMSTMKIQINQTISVLVRAMNNFQKIRLEDPYAVFDIFKLDCAGELLEILENLGLFVDVNGVVSEKKNLASFAGRSYGCSSVVNSTYSFIQPVEPAAITVQHQHMRSYTGAPTSFQSPTPFISCYIDSPPMSAKKSEPVYQPPRQQSMPPRQQSMPRRHCGLKGPYAAITPNRSPVKCSPIKRQMVYSDSEEESWDLDENVATSASAPAPAPAAAKVASASVSPPNTNYERFSYKYKHADRFNNNSRGHGHGKFFGHKRRY